MATWLFRRLERLACCVLVLCTCLSEESRSAEIIISDARQLRPEGGKLVGPLAFSLDDSCLAAVRQTTPHLQQPFVWQGKYLIFDLIKRERKDVPIPRGSSIYHVLSPAPDRAADLPPDNVLYLRGPFPAWRITLTTSGLAKRTKPAPMEVGWLKSGKSLASFEYDEQDDFEIKLVAVSPDLRALAVVAKGKGEREKTYEYAQQRIKIRERDVWTSVGRTELWGLTSPARKGAENLYEAGDSLVERRIEHRDLRTVL